MRPRYWVLEAFLAVALLGACTSDSSEDAEIWQEPVVTTEQNEPSIQPDSETQEKPPPVEEVESAGRPWEPDTSMGAEVSEGDLLFEGDSIKKGPEDGDDQISDAFNPNAGYENDDALTGGAIAPEARVQTARASGKNFWVSAKSVNVRTAPSAESPVVGTLTRGSMVKVFGDTAGWSKIGPNRYIRSRYLSSRK
jgi:uncharacterized protein YgiM (DUF1202 family)